MACLSMTDISISAARSKIPVLHVGEPVFKKPATLEEIREVRNQLIEGMVAQDEKAFTDAAARFRRLVCLIFGGKKGRRLLPLRKHDSYHRGTCLLMGIDGMPVEFKDILEQARQSESYECLTACLKDTLRSIGPDKKRRS